MTKLRSKSQVLINIYRSQGANNESFIWDVLELIDLNEHTIIVGDFNVCFQKNPTHIIFQTLRDLGFLQLVKNPTHINGGLIDLVFVLCSNLHITYEVIQQAQYYTDHDILSIR